MLTVQNAGKTDKLTLFSCEKTKNDTKSSSTFVERLLHIAFKVPKYDYVFKCVLNLFRRFFHISDIGVIPNLYAPGISRFFG